MLHVFISHAADRDEVLARRLAEDLERHGYQVWSAPEASTWAEAVNQGLSWSDVVVPVLTPAALQSVWVKREVGVAINLEMQGRLQIVFLDAGGVEPGGLPPLWRIYRTLPFQDYERDLPALLEQLEAGLTVPPEVPVRPLAAPAAPAPPAVGDKIVVGNIVDSTGVAIGPGARVVIHEYYTSDAAAATDIAQARLRVLVVIASPLDDEFPPLDASGEFNAIFTELKRAEEPVALVRLNPPTWSHLQRALQRLDRPYHVVHFVGHGRADGLYLEYESGEPDFIKAEDLALAFRDSQVELAVLNVCSSESPAQALIDAGVPAVIAHSRDVTDRAAHLLAETLYVRLADGAKIESALASARDALRVKLGAEAAEVPVLLGMGDIPLSVPEDIKQGTRVFTNEPLYQLPEELLDDFVNRHGELTDVLFPWFSELLGERKPRAVALTGVGGIGKTTLALAALRRYAWRFPGGIVYVNAEETPNFELHSLYRAMDGLLGTEIMKQADDAARLKMARDVLSANRYLLVLDGLDAAPREAVKALADFVRQMNIDRGSMALVISDTSVPDFEGLVGDRASLVEGLDETSAQALLRLLTDENPDAARELEGHEAVVAQLAHHHPGLLEMASRAFLKGYTWAEVRDDLQGVYSRGARETYERAVGRVIGVLVSDPQRGETVRDVLLALSTFASEASDEAIFHVITGRPPGKEREDQEQWYAIVEAILDARQAGLTTRLQKRTQLRPIVRQYIRTEWSASMGDRLTELRANHVAFFRDLTVERREQYADLSVAWAEINLALERAQAAGDGPTLVEMIRALTGTLGEVGPSGEGMRYDGGFLAVEGHWAEAEALLDAAIAAAQAMGDAQAEARLRYARGLFHLWQSELGDGEKQQQAAYALCEQVGDAYALAATRHELGNLALRRDDLPAAESAYREALSQREKLGDRPGMAETMAQLAKIEQFRGNLDAAIEMAGYGEEMWAAVGDERGRALALQALGSLYLEAGRLDQALDHLSMALEKADQLGDRRLAAGARRELGHLVVRRYVAAAKAGDLEETEAARLALGSEAAILLESALDIFEKVGDRQGMAQTYRVIGNAQLASGQIEEAIRSYDETLRIEREIGESRGVMQTQWNRAILYAFHLDPPNLEKARQAAEDSLRLAEQFGYAERAGDLRRLLDYVERLDADGSRPG